MTTHSEDTQVRTIIAIRQALDAQKGIALLREVLSDQPAWMLLGLMKALIHPSPDPNFIAERYSDVLQAFAEAVTSGESEAGISDAWQATILARLLNDTNPLSIQAERVGPNGLSPAIRAQAERDLRALSLFFKLDAQSIWNLTRDLVTPSLPTLADAWVPWYDLAPISNSDLAPTPRNVLIRQIMECEDWGMLVDPLIAHWARHGTGSFARYSAFRWEGNAEDQGLQGIAHPDPIQLSEIIGYNRQHNRLKANTERFLLGLPAHDAALYGAPGTGKSSTVKAIANAYANRGLRLIELRKELVNDLPRIIALLRGRAPRFLIFIDDLSFEDHETEYKALKVLLEGSVEARPKNVLIYITTNRLNLIREQFSDRGKPTEEVHWKDTMDEKHSLVARFGLRVTFTTPDQEHYLTIATGLARQRGIDLPEEELHARALTWERQHTGRSGRLARQFVDDLQAELGLNQ